MTKRKAGPLDLGDNKLLDRGNARKILKGSYTASQKAAINEFHSVTGADKTTSAKILKTHNWNIPAAANAFYNNPNQGNISTAQRNALTKLFDAYRDQPSEEPDQIGIAGTSKLLEEAQIPLDDIGALIFSELVSSPSLGRITREGFIDGCADVNADSVPKISNIVGQRRAQLSGNAALFKRVYNHTFTLALQEGQKSLQPEIAAEFWRMLFSAPGLEWKTSRTPWLDWWLQFQEEKWKRAVGKDLWRQTLAFAEASMKDDSLGFWSEESSWPSVIDEFVDWVKNGKRAGGASGADAMEIE